MNWVRRFAYHMDSEYSSPPQDEGFEMTVEEGTCGRRSKLVSRENLFVWSLIAILIIMSWLMVHERKPESVPPEYGQLWFRVPLFFGRSLTRWNSQSRHSGNDMETNEVEHSLQPTKSLGQ